MQKYFREKQLPILMLIAFAAINLVPQGATLALTVHLPRYFAKYGGVEFAAVGVAFSMTRLIDIIVDPALGMLMDRTRTRFGRYRPWTVAGAPILMVAIYMLFLAKPGSGQIYLIGWLLVFYAGTSIIYLSQSAWAGVLSGGYAERARIYGVIAFMGLLGPAVVLVAPELLGSKADTDVEAMHLMGWSMLILTPLFTALAAMTTPEPNNTERLQQRTTLIDYWHLLSRPLVWRVVVSDLCLSMVMNSTMAIFVFFWHDARQYTLLQTNMLLLSSLIAGMLGAAFWGWLGGRIGKHVALGITALSYAAGNIIIAQIPPGHYAVVFVLQSYLGFAGASFTMLLRAMVADIADLTRLEQGKESSGLLFALVTSTLKVGGALSIGLTFYLLQTLGYNPGHANTQSELGGLVLVYTWTPVFFSIVGAAFLWRYPLTAQRHAEIRAALDSLEPNAREQP